MKRKNRLIGTFIALTISCYCQGQLSDDSLKKICAQLFKDELIAANPKRNDIAGYEYTAQEAFPSLFADIKVFTVDMHPAGWICDDCPRRRYFLNIYTGKRPDLVKPDSLNKEMQKNSQNFSNVDKCYIYLIINDIPHHFMSPGHLYRFITKGSSFINSPSFEYHEDWNYYRNEEYRNLIDRSGKSTIYIGTSKVINNKEIITIYKFRFDKKGNLMEVSPISLQ